MLSSGLIIALGLVFCLLVYALTLVQLLRRSKRIAEWKTEFGNRGEPGQRLQRDDTDPSSTRSEHHGDSWTTGCGGSLP